MEWIKEKASWLWTEVIVKWFNDNVLDLFRPETYTDYIYLISTIFTTLLGLLAVHFVIFGIVGVFKKKVYPVSNEKLTYGIVVSARNEEAVISNIVESAKRMNYPQDKLKVFVIAHNCTDNTARLAREAGAIVYEYNNDKERTKGYALHHIFNCIIRDYGIDCCDGYLVHDADNIFDTNYLSKMNDAFVAMGKKNTITSFRNSKNFGSNIISALYGLFWLNYCRFENRGRTVLNCSTRVAGTGFLFSKEAVRNGWNYLTLTEDWEFSADQIIGGSKIYYCDEATFFDEQPTSVKIMWRQRVRWARGHLLVCVTRLGKILKSLILPKSKGGSKHKMSIYDILTNVIPSNLLSTIISVIQVILFSLTPLFEEKTFGTVAIDWLMSFATGLLSAYASSFLLAIILYIIERKRVGRIGIGTRVLSVLLYPIFGMINNIIVIVALFSKNLQWKTIPHNDKTKSVKLKANE